MSEIILCGKDAFVLNASGGRDGNSVRVAAQLLQQLRYIVYQTLIGGFHRRCHTVGAAPGVLALPMNSPSTYAAAGQDADVLDLRVIQSSAGIWCSRFEHISRKDGWIGTVSEIPFILQNPGQSVFVPLLSGEVRILPSVQPFSQRLIGIARPIAGEDHPHDLSLWI